MAWAFIAVALLAALLLGLMVAGQLRVASEWPGLLLGLVLLVLLALARRR